MVSRVEHRKRVECPYAVQGTISARDDGLPGPSIGKQECIHVVQQSGRVGFRIGPNVLFTGVEDSDYLDGEGLHSGT